MSIAEKIKAGRERLKMTEQAFANALDVSRGSVQQWEKGETAPNRKRQPAVAKLIGMTVAELMNDTDSQSAAPPDHNQNQPLAHTNKERSAIKTCDLAQALHVLADALSGADPPRRSMTTAGITELCKAPGSAALIDLICHTLEPPHSQKTVPETGGQRAAS